MATLFNFVNDESGAAAAEYALILSLIAIAIITAVTALGASITAALSNHTLATTLITGA